MKTTIMGKEFSKAMQEINKGYKEARKRGELNCSEAFMKYKYLICDLLGMPPDVLLPGEKWKELIELTQKKLDKK